MLRKASTTLVRSLMKQNPVSIISQRSFHSSLSTRMACIYESPDQIINRLISERSESARTHSSAVEILTTKNKQLEDKLCESRGLLSYLFHNNKKDLTDSSKIQLIKDHLNEHKFHRSEEHDVLISRLEKEVEGSQKKIDSLNEQKDKVEQTLKQEKEKMRDEVSKLENEIHKIYERGIAMDAELNRLKKTNVNSQEFLENREVEKDISNKFRI